MLRVHKIKRTLHSTKRMKRFSIKGFFFHEKYHSILFQRFRIEKKKKKKKTLAKAVKSIIITTIIFFRTVSADISL